MAALEDKEMAEEYVDTLLDKDDAELDKLLDEYLGDLKLNKKQAGAILGIIKGVGIGSYLAGLEAGRPKWHKVADGDLPNENKRYFCKIKEFVGSGISYECFDYDTEYSSWKNACGDVIAWCEIPKYTEENLK